MKNTILFSADVYWIPHFAQDSNLESFTSSELKITPSTKKHFGPL